MTQAEIKNDLKIYSDDIRELKRRLERNGDTRIDQVDLKRFTTWWDNRFSTKPRQLLYRLKTRELDVFVLHVLGDIDMEVIAQSCNYDFTSSQVEFLFKQAKKTLIEASGCSDILELFKLSRHIILGKLHCCEGRFLVSI